MSKGLWVLKLVLGGNKFVDEVWSLVGDVKVVKNDVELNGMRNCYICDGVVLIEFFVWLED